MEIASAAPFRGDGGGQPARGRYTKPAGAVRDLPA